MSKKCNPKINTLPLLLCLGLLLINISCSKSGASSSGHPNLVLNDTLPKYDLENPLEKYSLPHRLREISGLSYYKDDIVICVQDEKGEVFFYDLSKKEVIHTIDFGGSGDYEGIEIVGPMIYVTKSNGDLYQLPFDLESEKQEAKKIETDFSAKNDIESLGYDPQVNSLLMVTKAKGGIDKSVDSGTRGLYLFSLDEMKLVTKPQFIITNEQRRAFYKEKHPGRKYSTKDLTFMPSAIAVHPKNGNYYILASAGKMLLVTTPNGKILESHPIKPKILNQPEGICFAPDGTMYISSEGSNRGYMLKYKMSK